MIRSKEWAKFAAAFSLLWFVCQANSNAADYGRIKDPSNLTERGKAMSRCGDVPLPEGECEQGRQEAVRIGCISADEARQLKSWGLSPTCIAGKYRGWCACGCFHPLMLITVLNETLPVATAEDIAKNPKNYSLLHLGANTRLSSMEYNFSPLVYSTLGAEAKPLVVIETQDGRVLKVTSQHAIMTAQGEMIQAKDVKPETLLLDHSGSVVAIQAIRSEVFKDFVVNFRLDVKKPVEHVIFAQGLAVGDQAWQSTLEDLQNQIIVRQ